jgi:hypothetical protein
MPSRVSPALSPVPERSALALLTAPSAPLPNTAVKCALDAGRSVQAAELRFQDFAPDVQSARLAG